MQQVYSWLWNFSLFDRMSDFLGDLLAVFETHLNNNLQENKDF